MSAVLSVLRIEFRRIFTSRPAFGAMVIAILAYALLYPQPYLAEVLRDVPIAVIDQDNTTLSRDLIRRIDYIVGMAIIECPW